MDAFSQPNSWISQRLRAGTPTGMEGQPFTQFYEDAPYDLYTGGIQQGMAQPVQYQQDYIPASNRVLNVGRNDYNMQGTMEAARDYGIPPVMVQSSPYARIAYTYGPSGPIPLIGATSVYPHVVSSGRYDYGAPYMAQAFAMPNDGYSFDKLMAFARDIARMQMRARMAGGGSTGSGGTPKKPDEVALPPEGNVEPKPIPIVPGVPQLELPEPLPAPKDPLAPQNPLTVRAYRANDPNNPFRKNGSVGVPDTQDVTPPQAAPEPNKSEGGVLDWLLDKARQIPRNVKPKRAPEPVPVAPEAPSPTLVPDAIPVQPSPEPSRVPYQGLSPKDTLAAMMAFAMRPSILRG